MSTKPGRHSTQAELDTHHYRKVLGKIKGLVTSDEQLSVLRNNHSQHANINLL